MRVEVEQLPPREYSPNWRGHWAEKHKAGRIYQAAVYYACVDVRNKLERIPWQPGFPPFQQARLDLEFVFPWHRRRDRDNLIAMFKPGLDGIVQAGLIVDDDISHVSFGDIQVVVDRDRAPLTVITLTEKGG